MKGNRSLTDSEIQKCLNGFEGRFQLRNQALFVLGLNSGFRISELLSLKIKDVMPYNEIADYITVQRKNVKKKTQGQTVVVNDVTKKYLKNYLDQFESIFDYPISKDYYLFKSQIGQNKAICTKQGENILKATYRINELTGPLATHALRKTYAKNMHEALGGDINKTRVAMRHKEVSSTQSYLSFNEMEINTAVKELNLGCNLSHPREKMSETIL